MSLLHFSLVVDRAKEKKADHTSLLQAATIRVPCDTLIFAYEHIHLVEEQLAKQQRLAAQWKEEAIKAHEEFDALKKELTELQFAYGAKK